MAGEGRVRRELYKVRLRRQARAKCRRPLKILEPGRDLQRGAQCSGQRGWQNGGREGNTLPLWKSQKGRNGSTWHPLQPSLEGQSRSPWSRTAPLPRPTGRDEGPSVISFPSSRMFPPSPLTAASSHLRRLPLPPAPSHTRETGRQEGGVGDHLLLCSFHLSGVPPRSLLRTAPTEPSDDVKGAWTFRDNRKDHWDHLAQGFDSLLYLCIHPLLFSPCETGKLHKGEGISASLKAASHRQT